jgi:hypothetical protein
MLLHRASMMLGTWCGYSIVLFAILLLIQIGGSDKDVSSNIWGHQKEDCHLPYSK